MFAIDIILGISTAFAGTYCIIISKKLSRFKNLENGMGNAIAVFSAQVDDLKTTLERANFSAQNSTAVLQSLLDRAQISEKNLEMMMAALQDIPHYSSKPENEELAHRSRSRIRRSHLRAAE